MRAAFLACCLMLAASAAALQPLTDGLGREVRLADPARRIVSLSPSCTEVLFAIGAADRIAAVTAYCDYPAEAKKKPKVGGFSGKTISIESIVAFRPDLVIAEGQMHGKVIDMLVNARITCYAANALRIEDAYRIIRHLGVLSDREDAADAVAAAMRGRIDAVSRKVSSEAGASDHRPSAFWAVWDDPIMTSGGPTFISESISAAGGRNVFAEAPEQYPSVSFESVLSKDPDWLLSGTDHGARMNAQTLSVRQGWRSLRAVKEGRVAFVDADSINRAGPRLADAVENLARIFHPDLFPGGKP